MSSCLTPPIIKVPEIDEENKILIEESINNIPNFEERNKMFLELKEKYPNDYIEIWNLYNPYMVRFIVPLARLKIFYENYIYFYELNKKNKVVN